MQYPFGVYAVPLKKFYVPALCFRKKLYFCSG